MICLRHFNPPNSPLKILKITHTREMVQLAENLEKMSQGQKKERPKKKEGCRKSYTNGNIVRETRSTNRKKNVGSKVKELTKNVLQTYLLTKSSVTPCVTVSSVADRMVAGNTLYPCVRGFFPLSNMIFLIYYSCENIRSMPFAWVGEGLVPVYYY